MQGDFQVKEKLSELMKNKNTVKVLFIAGIVGIVLIFLSSVIPKGQDEAVLPEETEFSEAEYCAALEEDIRQMVQAICGDSAAIVTVTLDTGMVYEYANEIKQNNAEDDTKTSSESEESYIIVKDSSGAETPLIITAYMPKIRGVSVICNTDEAATEQIKNAVCAALDITSRKIYIGRKTGQ